MSFKTPALPTSLPTEPYIVTTPSDLPFSTPDWQRDNWRIEGWFEPNERHLQYQTFLWRDPSESLFQLRTAYEMRAGPAEAMRKEKERQARNAGTLGNVGAVVAKKKISMSDYKKKGSPAVAQGDTVNQSKTKVLEEKKTSTEVGNIEPIPMTKDEQSLARVEEQLYNIEAQPLNAQSTITTKSTTSHQTQNNKPDEVEIMKPSEPRKRRISEVLADTDVRSSIKKPRTAEEQSTIKNSSEQAQRNTKDLELLTRQPAVTTATSRQAMAATTEQVQSAPSWRGRAEGAQRKPSSLPTPPHHEDSMPKDQHDLPKWRSSSKKHGLSTPPRLSNDFRKVDRTPPRYSAVSQRAQPTQVMSPPPSTSSPDSVRMSITYSSNSSEGGDSIEEKKPAVFEKGVARKRPVSISDIDIDNSKDEVSATSVPEDDELLVKLKFSKGLRKDVQRILQLKPSPRPPTQSEPTQATPQKERNVNADVASVNQKDRGLKHTRRPDGKEIYVPPAKRQKLDLPALAGDSRTPLPSTAGQHCPPVISRPSSSLHRQVLTPKKDKELTKKSSVSSLFQVSRNNQSTPQRPPPAISTPVANVQTTTTTPQSAARPSNGAKWRDEHKRLSDTGRKLKHKMQEVTLNRASPGTSTSDKHHHLAAVHGIESLLSFMLSFVARELSLSPEKRAVFTLSTYSSMGPFGKEVSRVCLPWPHLTGMVNILLATCQGVVVGAAGATGGYADAATPADAGSTVVRDEKKELEKLTAAIKDMQRHAQTAAKLLPLDVMTKEYPTAAAAAEHGSPFATLGMQPSVAVKMGKAFLDAYTTTGAGRGVGWEATLDLGDAGEL